MKPVKPERCGRFRGRLTNISLLGVFVLCGGCERQSIDLLPDEGADGGTGSPAQGGTTSAASGSGGTGVGTSAAGGASGASFLDGGWKGNCPAGENCPDDPNFECPPNVEACQRCERDNDCDWPLHCAFNGRCVQCRDDADCDDPGASRCHPLSHQCVPYCDEFDDTCPNERPICDDDTKSCGQCLVPSHCQSLVCIWGECVECVANGDCPQEQPFCRNFSCRPTP